MGRRAGRYNASQMGVRYSRVALAFEVAIIAIVLGGRPMAQDVPDEVLLLAKIKQKAAKDLSHLPSFTCLATFHRAERRDERQPFVHVDIVRAEIAYVNGQELFAWPGSSGFESGSLAQIAAAGLLGSGEFVAHARTVFVDDVGTTRFGAYEEYGGRAAVRYDFQVSPLFSGYRLSVPEGEAVIGMKGSFWADRNTTDLLGLSILGDEIPPHLGVRSTHTEIEYGRILMAGASIVLVPQTATTTFVSASGKQKRYAVQYTHCREYSATSAISFESPRAELLVPSKPASQVEVSIPPLVVVPTRLITQIDSDKASVGDPISASVVYDVKRKDKIVIPAGALLTGRIRMLQKDGSNRFIVGLEFTDVTFAGKHARFIADLQSIDRADGVQMLLKSDTYTTTSEPYQSLEIRRHETVLPPQVPGVATFFVLQTKRFGLSPGLGMEWRTIRLEKAR